MSDMRTGINRAFRTYLEPPNARAAIAKLDGAINDTVTSLTVDLASWQIPEDEELMRNGVLLEIDAELIEVLTYDELTGICTVVRGVEGTTATAHLDRNSIKLSPNYPRQSVFDALADNIVNLYPTLYTVRAMEVMGPGVAAMEDPLAVDIVEMWAGASGYGSNIEGRIVDFHPSVGGRAVIFDGDRGNGGPGLGSAWVRYRRRFGSATSEDDTFEELGLDSRWVNIAIIGACADLFIGADMEASQVEWVGGVLAAENIPVGTRSQVAAAMLRYREVLIDKAKSEMRAEYKTRMRFRPTQVSFR